MTRAKDISKIITSLVTEGGDNLFRNNSGSSVLSLISNTSGTSILKLGDTDDFDIGQISYNNSNNSMEIKTNDGAKLVIDSVGNFTLPLDNQKILLGASNDLQIYHNGSDSYIVDSGTGGLNIQADSFNLRNAAGNETGFQFIQDGAVNFFHNGSIKMSTNANGIGVEGTIVGTTSIIPDAADGAHLGSTGAEWSDLYLADGGIIYFGHDQDVFLEHIPDTGLRLTDNDKLIFGASNDLQIYHDGSNSFVDDNGTGNLFLRGSAQVIIGNMTGEQHAVFVENGQVALNFDNSEKFRTTSSGISVTGTVSATSGNFSNGDINVTGTGNRAISVLSDDGLGTMEIGGATGGFLDIKQPKTDDFDIRLGSSGTGGYLSLAAGTFTISGGMVNSLSGYQTNGTVLPFQSTPTIASTASGISIGTGYTTILSQAIQHDANDRIILLAQVHMDTQSSSTAGQGDIRILASNTSQSAEIISQALLCDGARLRWNYTFALSDSRGISAVTTYTIQARKTHGSLTFNGGGAATKIILIKQTV